MTISKITKKNFSIFLKTEVQIIDGDIISDSGKNKGHYYFVKIPISEKVCALYGQKFRRNELLNYRKELIYFGLVSKEGDVAFYSCNYANLFLDCYSGSADKETYLKMAELLYEKLCEMNPETEVETHNPYYIAIAQKIAFQRAVCGNSNYKNALMYLAEVAQAPLPRAYDNQPSFDLFIHYLESPEDWADYAIDTIDKFYVDGKYPAFSASVGRDVVSVERMARRYIAKYNEPGSKENAYKKMFSAFGDALTVRLKLEIDGDMKKVLYPAAEIACPQTVEKDSVPTEYIYPLRMRKEVEKFLAKHGLSNDRIPIGCVKAIYYGNQTFWKISEPRADTQ